MKSIAVSTSDNVIWNQSSVYAEIAQAMSLGQPFILDLLNEGPDLQLLGLYDFLTAKSAELDYSLTNIKIINANALERHHQIRVLYKPPIHLLDNAKDYVAEVPKNTQLKHFGMFIGRSNAQRLHLATYLDSKYYNKTIMSYHFNLNDDFHINNIGLENLIKNYGFTDIREECSFIHRCPLRLKQATPVVIDKNLSLNPSQQLYQNDKDYFSQTYRDFFVELVCESYFTGKTFFPTEKVFRPILLKTPFIVQGPQYFLHNLRALGFKTFSNWWNEGYAEDPDGQQLVEIKQVLDTLAQTPTNELIGMYNDMNSVVEHNYNVAMSLTTSDFEKLANEIK